MKNLLFVDDEPRVLQGLQRQLHGMRKEWEMTYLDNGAKALAHMSTHPVDVIVTDMMMPGMDGAQLLTEVRNQHPNTVRIVLSGHADRESVLRLVGPAHQYLSKPCDGDELRVAISRAFALRELLGNDKLKALAARTGSLPTLPELHNQLTAELRQEEPSIERIGEIISKDIGMTSKMLQLVNSAFFGLPQPITSATEAVSYLGLTTVRALVLSLQVFSQYDQKKIKGFSIDALSHHSWMTGVLARRIAEVERCDPKISDQCFLAGLLHDIGQLILASGLPDEYSQVIERTRVPGNSLCAAEQDQFGTTHAELGAYLLGLWSLPNPVIEAVALHHRPASAPAGKLSPTVAVHVADGLAHEKNGAQQIPAPCAIDLNCLAALGLEKRLDIWRAKCFEEEL